MSIFPIRWRRLFASAGDVRCIMDALANLNTLGEKIMAAISDFAAKQKEFNDRQATALGSVSESISDVAGDVKTLNDKIMELQNSPGQVTPGDQTLLDELQTAGQALTEKAEAAAAALKALNDLTPPAVPK